MANYKTRAEAVVANLRNKDQTLPTNAQLNTLYTGFIYAYPQYWNQLLSNANSISGGAVADSVVNPDNPSDLTDIGVLDSADVFSAHSVAIKLNFARFHFLREMKRHAKAIYQLEVKRTTALEAGDAGKTVPEIQAEVASEAVTESTTVVGDEDNDPET